MMVSHTGNYRHRVDYWNLPTKKSSYLQLSGFRDGNIFQSRVMGWPMHDDSLVAGWPTNDTALENIAISDARELEVRILFGTGISLSVACLTHT